MPCTAPKTAAKTRPCWQEGRGGPGLSRPGHCVTSSSAASSPSTVGSSATTSGGRPSSSAAVFAVLGPMQATRTLGRQSASRRALPTKFFTVDELVNVTASIVPAASRARTSSAPAPSMTFSYAATASTAASRAVKRVHQGLIAFFGAGDQNVFAERLARQFVAQTRARSPSAAENPAEGRANAGPRRWPGRQRRSLPSPTRGRLSRRRPAGRRRHGRRGAGAKQIQS